MVTSFAAMRVVFAAALCVSLVDAVQAQVSAQLAQKAPEAAEIAAIAAQQGYVRVIVQFAAPGVPTELRPDAEFLAPIKTQMASLQDAIIASHFGGATSFPRNLVRMEIRPLIAVNVSQSELNDLAADPRIVSINYDRPVPPTLIQSVPLIGMPQAYDAGGTGARQAVAILDTGAQRNHVFLSVLGLVSKSSMARTSAIIGSDRHRTRLRASHNLPAAPAPRACARRVPARPSADGIPACRVVSSSPSWTP
jgi:hypothetical protein